MYVTKRLVAILSLIMIASLVPTLAPGQSTTARVEAKPDAGSFLSKGSSYRIVFPESFNMFTTRKTEVTQSTTSTGGKIVGRRPVVWNISLTCQYFIVTKLGPRGWVQIEHPAESKDYGKWGIKLIAMQAIAEKAVADTELPARQKEAATPIVTAKTWINIDRAIAVQDVPPRMPKVHASVTATQSDQ